MLKQRETPGKSKPPVWSCCVRASCCLSPAVKMTPGRGQAHPGCSAIQADVTALYETTDSRSVTHPVPNDLNL